MKYKSKEYYDAEARAKVILNLSRIDLFAVLKKMRAKNQNRSPEAGFMPDFELYMDTPNKVLDVIAAIKPYRVRDYMMFSKSSGAVVVDIRMETGRDELAAIYDSENACFISSAEK